MVTAHQQVRSQQQASPARHTRLRDVALMLATAGSTQTGAALGAHAFPAIGPAGVVAVRQLVAAAVLLPLGRPAVRSLRWAQWWPILLLAGVFAVMNLAVYITIDRIGLALAITLEFLGPLAAGRGTSCSTAWSAPGCRACRGRRSRQRSRPSPTCRCSPSWPPPEHSPLRPSATRWPPGRWPRSSPTPST